MLLEYGGEHGVIISNDLSDIHALISLLYAKTNMLRQHFYYSYAGVKKTIFIAFFMFVMANIGSCKFVVRKAIYNIA